MGTTLSPGAEVDPSSSQEAPAAAEGQLRWLHLTQGGLAEPALCLPSLPGDLQGVSQTQLVFSNLVTSATLPRVSGEHVETD